MQLPPTDFSFEPSCIALSRVDSATRTKYQVRGSMTSQRSLEDRQLVGDRLARNGTVSAAGHIRIMLCSPTNHRSTEGPREPNSRSRPRYGPQLQAEPA